MVVICGHQPGPVALSGAQAVCQAQQIKRPDLHLTPLGPPVKQSAIAARITRIRESQGGPVDPPLITMLTYPLRRHMTGKNLRRELPSFGMTREDP